MSEQFATQAKYCEWTYDPVADCWDTGCDESYVLMEGGTPLTNKVRFCPACGRRTQPRTDDDATPGLRAKVVARGDEEDV